MATQVFTLILDQPPTDAELGGIEQACPDATYGTERGTPIVAFGRPAASLADGIASAVRDIEQAGRTVVGVVDEDLLTLADIADRIGQSRESVRRYSSGERGPGGFPPPVNPTREGATFYRWSEVAPWLRDRIQVEAENPPLALVVANLVLQARQHRRVPGFSTLTALLDPAD